MKSISSDSDDDVGAPRRGHEHRMLRYERVIGEAITDVCYRGTLAIVYDLDLDLDLSAFILEVPYTRLTR